MQPAQPPNHRTPTAFWFGVLALLVIAPSLLMSCNGSGRNQRTDSSPSPQGSPTPTPEGGTQYLRGDTPIVVKGGGSIDLDFDDSAYTGTGNPTCVGCKITSVTLEQLPPAGQPATASPVPCTLPAADPEIKVKTAGGTHDITVKKVTNGVEVAFPKANYPSVVNACGDEKKRHSHAGVIQQVTVNGNACSGCSGPRCKVVIHVF